MDRGQNKERAQDHTFPFSAYYAKMAFYLKE